MKIAISHKLQTGPWGGGNAFVSNLCEFLLKNNVKVLFDLKEPDLDFILLTDPRSRSPNVTFSTKQIVDYIKYNKQTIVIHRINECDERKNTKLMNLRLRLANYCADHTVYVGSWLKDLDLTYKYPGKSTSVILNGADAKLFNSKGYKKWTSNKPLKIVTHHWSGNWMKGFEVYSKIDTMLNDKFWKNRIEFTYIGNLPKSFKFNNVNYQTPLAGKDLANELRKHHVYLTASINEPGGNHQIEGALCGLPLIYVNSGCMPEYCRDFGIIFEGLQIEKAIKDMIKNYKKISPALKHYPNTSNNTNKEWLSLLIRLSRNKNKLIHLRGKKNSMFFKFANLFTL